MRQKAGTNQGAASRCTMIRRVQVQRWPVVAKDARTHSSTAWRRCASSSTMAALLPPISSASRRPGRSRFACMMLRPTGHDPVKRMPSSPSCATKALATAGPPWTRLNTPGGSSAARMHSAISCPTSGVRSLGLNTIVLPSSSAGTQCPLGRCAGKLNGPSTAITPCERKLQRPARVGAIWTSHGRTRAWHVSPRVIATLSARSFASRRDSASVLPISAVIARAMSSARAVKTAASRFSAEARASWPAMRQPSNAARADATAASTAAGSARALQTTSSGRAGLTLMMSASTVSSGRSTPPIRFHGPMLNDPPVVSAPAPPSCGWRTSPRPMQDAPCHGTCPAPCRGPCRGPCCARCCSTPVASTPWRGLRRAAGDRARAAA